MVSEGPDEIDSAFNANSESASKGKGKLKVGLGSRLIELRDEDLPPSPAKPEVDRRMPWELQEGEGRRSVKDVKELRRDVLTGLEDVCERYILAIIIDQKPELCTLT